MHSAEQSEHKRVALPEIKKKLGISGLSTEDYTWFYRPSAEQEETGAESGAQIDLLIERGDRTIHLCEEKFVSSEFVIDREYEMNLRNKRETFRQVTGTKKTLNLTMITTYGIKNGKYSNLISGQVVLDDLFEKCEH